MQLQVGIGNIDDWASEVAEGSHQQVSVASYVEEPSLIFAKDNMCRVARQLFFAEGVGQ